MLAATADRLYRVEFEPPFERHLPWLHSVCRGDWVFRIDGDEVPSSALIKSLPGLISDPAVLQYRVPRCWVFPDSAHWLASAPWTPDYQIRVVKNDPATLRFRGTLHSSAEPALPARYLAEPIYHLALLLTTRSERAKRVRRYEALGGSQSHVDNRRFYLPESFDDLSLATTPIEDLAFLQDIVAEPAAPAARHTPVPARSVSSAEVIRLWAGRDLDDAAYKVEITCLEEDPRFVAARGREVPVLLRNRGHESFPWGDWSPPVRAAYHWLTGDRDPFIFEGHRTLLPGPLGPGQETIVPLYVVAPSEPGRYTLEIDLVHEGVRWFQCCAQVTATIEAPSEPPKKEIRPALGSNATRLICVTGMHRSGTSMVARIVNLLGVHLGDPSDLVQPADDNRAGFWEHREIVGLNDEVLATMGGSAAVPPALPTGWELSSALDPLRERATEVIQRLSAGHALAGWKDPRTSLTLPFWRTVAPIQATVLVLRHPLEVLRSLIARDSISEGEAARLYVRYNLAALQNDPACAVVTFEELFNDADATVERLTHELPLEPPDAMTAERLRTWIDPALRHHRLEEQQAANASAAVANAVYMLLASDQRAALSAFGPMLSAWASRSIDDADGPANDSEESG